MDILTPLIPALSAGLVVVGEKIIEKLVEVGSRPAAEQLDKWLHKDYQAEQSLAALRHAMLGALDELLEDKSLGSYERVVMTLKLTDLPAELRQVLAAAAVEMVRPEAGSIPDGLLQQ
jgi:hypothetical protein